MEEPAGAVREFSLRGYLERALVLERTIEGELRRHCLRVAWPAGRTNSAGAPAHVAEHIHAAWTRAILNTLAQVPFSHAQVLRRVVIDNRPREHGIAPFDRQRADDARDGHTLWLHEHLFRTPNHWASGNYGRYYAYHTDRDGPAIDGLSDEHDRISPVIIHELGHLVLYAVVHAGMPGALATSTPDCARTCRDDGSCGRLSPAEQERGCISPYCGPFAFPGSSENWAEQYRFYYQSSATRALLTQHGMGCREVLERHDTEANAALAELAAVQPPRSVPPRSVPPWQRERPDSPEFRASRWDSCGGRACKAY